MIIKSSSSIEWTGEREGEMKTIVVGVGPQVRVELMASLGHVTQKYIFYEIILDYIRLSSSVEL